MNGPNAGTNSLTDSSIPLQAGRGVPQNNQLQTIGDFANVQNSINQNKLFPGQLAQQGIQTQGMQSDLIQKQRQLGAASMIPLLAKKGPISVSDAMGALAGFESTGGVSQPMVAGVAKLPMTGDPTQDDATLRAYIAANAQPPNAAAAAVTPGAGPLVSNGQTQFGTTVAPAGSPGTGQLSVQGAQVPQYLSPQDLASQHTRLATADDAQRLDVPIGSPITETLGQRLQQQGQGGLAGTRGVVGTAGPVSPQSPPRLARPSAGVQTGMAPTAPAEMAASAEQYNVASAASNTFQQRVFPLQQAATALKNTSTGPGSETVNQIKSFLLAQSPNSLQKYLPGVDPEKIANYDEAVKYLASYAMNQPGAANSDMHLGLAQTANASTHISQEAAQRVVQNALGLERMQQAAVLQFNDAHPEPGAGAQFNRYMQNFSASHDPRGFSWDEQGAAQQQSALKSMTAADKRRLLESVTLARKYQLTGAPGG